MNIDKVKFSSFYDEFVANKNMFKGDSQKFIEELKEEVFKPIELKPMTENGKMILGYMQEHPKDNTSKKIADGLGINSRTVSGAMRKLITEEYVRKIDSSPITYILTELGKSYTVDND